MTFPISFQFSGAVAAARLPTEAYIRQRAAMFPDETLALLEAKGGIHIVPLSDPIFPMLANGQRAGGLWTSTGVYVAETQYYNAALKVQHSYLQDHELGHVTAEAIGGIWNWNLIQQAPLGYTAEIQTDLAVLYAHNGFSDLGPGEDLAEAFHDWFGPTAHYQRGRSLFRLGTPAVLDWMERLTAGRTLYPPPWAPPALPMVEVEKSWRAVDLWQLAMKGLTDVRFLDETVPEFLDEMHEHGEAWLRAEYWMRRSVEA